LVQLRIAPQNPKTPLEFIIMQQRQEIEDKTIKLNKEIAS